MNALILSAVHHQLAQLQQLADTPNMLSCVSR